MNGYRSRHIFLSYVREDSVLVEKLTADLTERGIHVWLDRLSIKPGYFWKDAIRQAIIEGDFFIACFSSNYASRDKSYMNEELTVAIEELRKYGPSRPFFIPLLLSECDVPASSIGAGKTLLDLQWVPMYQNWEEGIERIISTINPINSELDALLSAFYGPDNWTRYQASQAIIKLGDKAALPHMKRALSSKSPHVREKAVDVLASLGGESYTKEICTMLEDPTFKVRQTALLNLKWRCSPMGKDMKGVIKKLLSDRSNVVRKTAEYVLGFRDHY